MVRLNHSIRQDMIAQRQSLTAAQVSQAADQLCLLVQSQQDIAQACHIAVYLPVGNELDLTPTIQWLWQQNKACYLPILHRYRQGHLWFAPYTQDSPLRGNRYGILEPCVEPHHFLAPWELDLVLLPVVAFDRVGNRLGMGGGYYDRSFVFCGDYPRRIGCAYDFQKVEQLAAQPWDVALHSVICC